MWLSPLYLTFLFEPCLLGLASLLGALLLWTFWRFIPNGENVRPKQARFREYETKGGECEHRKRRSKRGEV
jgi:hypothetical protein